MAANRPHLSRSPLSVGHWSLGIQRRSLDDGMAMDENNSSRLPPGRQPYDVLNGLRVGAFAGLALGAVAAAVTRIPWLLLIGVVVGAIAGYLWERRRLREDLAALPPSDERGE